MTQESVVGFYNRLLNSITSHSGLAYRYYGETATYPQLRAVIAKVWSILSKRSGDNVIQFGEKSLINYGAVFGILFSGNRWVPLSSELPLSRQLNIFDQTRASLVVTDSPLPLELDNYAKENSIEVIRLDLILEKMPTPQEINIAPVHDDDIAYIMFTSGSTGTPKGVPMTHGNYINFIHNTLDIIPFREGEVFSDYHDWAFDISVFYLFCCPLTGGIFAPVRTKDDKVLPLRFMQENKVTVWSSVPSVIARIQTIYNSEKPETNIRVMFLCGEPFSLKVLDYCFHSLKIDHVYNFYGLTETGVENFYHYCSHDDLVSYESYGFVPIGRPLPGNDIRISDENELLLSGCQVTPGYLGDQDKDKFEYIEGGKWFHTGDVILEAQGVFFCKGRLDSQVKISGYRIELMDIEVNIKRFKGVVEAVCVAGEWKGGKQIIAAILAEDGQTVDCIQLKTFLNNLLPVYMVPRRFQLFNELPLNQNGKTDRKRIREMLLST